MTFCSKSSLCGDSRIYFPEYLQSGKNGTFSGNGDVTHAVYPLYPRVYRHHRNIREDTGGISRVFCTPDYQ